MRDLWLEQQDRERNDESLHRQIEPPHVHALEPTPGEIRLAEYQLWMTANVEGTGYGKCREYVPTVHVSSVWGEIVKPFEVKQGAGGWYAVRKVPGYEYLQRDGSLDRIAHYWETRDEAEEAVERFQEPTEEAKP